MRIENHPTYNESMRMLTRWVYQAGREDGSKEMHVRVSDLEDYIGDIDELVRSIVRRINAD